MSKTGFNSSEFVSLNSELTEFSLNELEERLETDPLAVGGLLDLASSSDSSLLSTGSEDCEYCSGQVSCNIH